MKVIEIQLTDHLLDALRERTGTKVLGFYISSGKKIDRYTLEKYFPHILMMVQKKYLIEKK